MSSQTREVPLQKDKCALLVIDMQQYCIVAGCGFNAGVDPDNIPKNRAYFFSQLANNTIPAIQTLFSAFRTKPARKAENSVIAKKIDQPILGCLIDVNFSIVLVEILPHQELKYLFYIHNRYIRRRLQTVQCADFQANT